MPRVSIGMPIYNGERYLRKSVTSILEQTFTDLELIVSDNASTDATREIVLEFAARDPRVRYYRNERNMGASYNYCRVIELGEGEFFRHAAYDDVLAPTNIERCVEELDRYPKCVLAYPRMTTIDAEGRALQNFEGSLDVRERSPHQRYFRFNRVMNPGCMCDPVFGLFRMSVLRQTKMLQNFMSADVFLLLEMVLRGEVHEIPEYLFFERWHADGSVRANPTFESRALWFDPNNAGNLWNYLPRWRWLAEHVRSVWRTDMPLSEKVFCLGELPKIAWENRRGLVFNLVALGEHFAHPAQPVSTAGKL
jgi:glycosyltransferase involved in cell wall biosynthesis